MRRAILSALLLTTSPALAESLPSNARPAEPAADVTDLAEGATDGRQTALMARIFIKVAHPVASRQAIVEDAKALGGFPTLMTDDRVHLKVPPGQLDAVMQRIAARGHVIDKGLERVDVTDEIAQLEAQLRSKTEIFERLRRFIDDSNVQATLQIERQMTALVAELEHVRGRLRVARERARWAVVTVQFNFQRQDKITYVRSPFGWLNTVDLDRFLRDF